MVELNLLPDVKKEFLRAERSRRRTIAFAILATIVAAGITILFAFYVYGVQSVVLYTQTQDIKKKSTDLSNIKDIDKYITIQNQLANLSQLHEGKSMFSRLLDFLPTLNPAPPRNVTLTNLDVSVDTKTLIFKGTVNDFAALTTFKDTLENSELNYKVDDQQQSGKLFSKVSIDSAGLDSNKVTFSVSAEYDENAFMQKSTDVSVRVPNKETTQSVVGTPQPIFDGGTN